MVIPVAVIELDETHAALGQPARQQTVVGECAGLRRIWTVQFEDAGGSFDRSVSSGTDVCIRNAISYCAMRVAISGSPKSLSLSSLNVFSASRYTRRFSAGKPAGFDEIQNGIADRAELHALIARGQKAAAPQPVVERLAAATCPGEIITTKAGRSSVSQPRP